VSSWHGGNNGYTENGYTEKGWQPLIGQWVKGWKMGCSFFGQLHLYPSFLGHFWPRLPVPRCATHSRHLHKDKNREFSKNRKWLKKGTSLICSQLRNLILYTKLSMLKQPGPARNSLNAGNEMSKKNFLI